MAREGVRLETGTLALKVDYAPGTGYRCGHCGEGVPFVFDHLESRMIRYRWGKQKCRAVKVITIGGISERISNFVKILGRRSCGFGDFHCSTLHMLDATGARSLINAFGRLQYSGENVGAREAATSDLQTQNAPVRSGQGPGVKSEGRAIPFWGMEEVAVAFDRVARSV